MVQAFVNHRDFSHRLRDGLAQVFHQLSAPAWRMAVRKEKNQA
ncbi:MAG: hypothetical protein ABSH08_10175 [Tepidisphaeraceae bacterium]